MWELRNAEFNVHVAALRNTLGIFNRLPGIGEESLHLLLALDIILSALIAHSVLVRQLFAGLDTEQDIVRLHIIGVGIMNIVGGNKGNIQFLAHLKQRGIHHFLLRQTVVLKL